MRTTAAPTKELVHSLNEALEHQSTRKLARTLSVHHETLSKAARGEAVEANALEKLARIAPRVRAADEFKGTIEVTAPNNNNQTYSWDLEKIRAARDSQMNGNFALPVQLAEASKTDDAIFNAWNNRLAPQESVGVKLISAGGARGDRLIAKAEQSVFVPRPVVAGILGTLVDHGIAIGYNEQETDDTGTQIDFRHVEWPLEFVRWNPSLRTLQTRTKDHGTIDITHGDGRWVVYRKFHRYPWRRGAAILPAALIWAAHAEGLADWAGATRAHGLAKIVGELQAGTALTGSDGGLTPEARAFLQLLIDLASGNASAGVRPSGSKVDFLANGSTAWQVFSELITNREKAAARVYLGTDAIMGSQGGAPGVDISTLFGVATTKVQGDFEALETGLRTGVYEPWCAINEGTSRYAPWLQYQMPDPDEDAKRGQRASNYKRLTDTIAALRAQGLVVTQEIVNRLASDFGVDVVLTLSAKPLAPTA